MAQTQAQIALDKIRSLERRHAALIAGRAKKPAGGLTAPGTGGSGSTGSSSLSQSGSNNNDTGGAGVVSTNANGGTSLTIAHTGSTGGNLTVGLHTHPFTIGDHSHTGGSHQHPMNNHTHGVDHTHSCSVSISALWTAIDALTAQVNGMA